jgi:hypothetical protein
MWASTGLHRGCQMPSAGAELPEEKVEATRSSRMDPRHAHLDKMLDPK